ncbi:WGR domain-containing protein [Agrobacterium vitis]|uniref:WGR domain-containing protein n=1 Tax=Agrobacterium vitis TaxID=373 RepID=A0A6L6VHW6_AGRVI|nr:WGR domain-containing protein [Agrobacterium vitis]MUZ74445.1 WGR domain-containing protein [Agrobacterium vitis]
MIAQPYHLYIERTDASKNMARYYAMEISPTLFGEACLTRTWGRIGKRGRTKIHHFARERDAVLLFLDLLRQKRARGYVAVTLPAPIRIEENEIGAAIAAPTSFRHRHVSCRWPRSDHRWS